MYSGIRSDFFLPRKIKILQSNNLEVSKDQKMKKNQGLTGPFLRSRELIEATWSRFLEALPSFGKQPHLYLERYALEFDVDE